MKHINQFPKEKLITPILVPNHCVGLAKQVIDSYPDPIPKLIADGLVAKTSFYRILASIYNLAYCESLDISLSSYNSVAHSIPLPVLINAQAFPYEESGVLYVAVSSPFVSDETARQLLKYTSYDTFTIVITPPHEIQNALNCTFYTELSLSTEDRIHVLHPHMSTKTYHTFLVPQVYPIFLSICWVVSVLIFPINTVILTFFILNVIYFFTNPFKIYIYLKSLFPQNALTITKSDIEELSDAELPIYTILVPLMHEEQVIPSLVKSLSALEYPKEKLDIKFIVELGDQKTIRALNKEGIGVSSADADTKNLAMSVVKVPRGSVLTKPRSCNYALGMARGTYTVIYDAEDRPEPDQLKKAFIAFQKSTLDTICMQARLNFYNTRQNLLTRLFALEYGFWFDYYLPGLGDTSAPIPLGGTSNHFVTAYLRSIGTWDPYNVTEDADVGLRISRYKFKTGIINSYTFEEANSHINNWIRQRTRWQKGYLVTFLVHTSRPMQFVKNLGFWRALLSCGVFGTSFFMPLMNPVLWGSLLLSFNKSWLPVEINLLNTFILTIALFNLVVGNLTYIVLHLLAAAHARRMELLPYTIFLPLYWVMISVATVRAGIQFVMNPYYWEKTKHGLHLPDVTKKDIDIYYKFE